MKLTADDFNGLPQKIKSGELTELQAVHQLAEFVLLNKPLYKLNQYDEDFINDLIVSILENGVHVFEKFNTEYGSFFNYFYNYVKNLVYTKFRSESRKAILENFNTSESIYSYSDVMESYSKMNYGFMEETHVPYTAKKVSPEALKAGFKIPCIKQITSNNHRFILNHVKPEKKALLVISLKAAFYLNDTKIKIISDICNIQQNDLQLVIQEIKDNLNKRMERKHELEEKRNRTYYNFCKFNTMSKKDGLSLERKNQLTQKASVQLSKLDKINSQLNKGVINIRPSNKTISEIVGISERQISYYIKIANNTEEFRKVIGDEFISTNSHEN